MKGASRIVILCSFLSLGMGSCSGSLKEACEVQLPRFQQSLAQARREVGIEIARMDPQGDTGGGRAIASVGGSGNHRHQPPDERRFFELSGMEKRKWQDWSAKRLELTERYLDIARTQTQMENARQPLSDLAESLVDFNGYVGRGMLYQMRESLEAAQADAENAAQQGCGAYSRP